MNVVAGFVFRRVRWVAAGWLVKTATRRGVQRSIESAGAEVQAKIEARLPGPVRSAADALGVDVAELGGKVGGPALIARQHSRRVGNAAAVTARGGRRAVTTPARVRRRLSDGAADLRSQFDAEVDEAGRRLRSRAAGRAAGPLAATDALLDLRRSQPTDDPLPEVPEPVRRGRRAAIPDPPAPEQARVQRSYRPPIKRWDRQFQGRPPGLEERNSGQRTGWDG